METIIKNIHLLKPHLSEKLISDLEQGASLYRRHSRITFKILRLADNVLTVETRQDKSPAENYLDGKTLYERTKELFAANELPEGIKLHINTIPYKPSPTEIITPEYIRHFLTDLKIKVKDVAADTGVDKTNISAWVNGTREMSQIVKAMFYYYLETKRTLGSGKVWRASAVRNSAHSNDLKRVEQEQTESFLPRYHGKVRLPLDPKLKS